MLPRSGVFKRVRLKCYRVQVKTAEREPNTMRLSKMRRIGSVRRGFRALMRGVHTISSSISGVS